jgi:L-amino acid N-acyltransferase YncA
MLHLRDATIDDAAAIASIYAPYCDATPISFEIAAPSVEEIAARLAKILPSYPWLVCEEDNRVRGYAYAGQHRERAAYRWGVDVAIYLDGEFHRRGIGRALYSTLFQMLLIQGYFTAYAGITMPNAASFGLHRAMGFEPVGVYHNVGYKFGAWHDVVWMEKSLQPLVAMPAEPVSAAQLRGSKRWADALVHGQRLLAS